MQRISTVAAEVASETAYGAQVDVEYVENILVSQNILAVYRPFHAEAKKVAFEAYYISVLIPCLCPIVFALSCIFLPESLETYKRLMSSYYVLTETSLYTISSYTDEIKECLLDDIVKVSTRDESSFASAPAVFIHTNGEHLNSSGRTPNSNNDGFTWHVVDAEKCAEEIREQRFKRKYLLQGGVCLEALVASPSYPRRWNKRIFLFNENETDDAKVVMLTAEDTWDDFYETACEVLKLDKASPKQFFILMPKGDEDVSARVEDINILQENDKVFVSS